MWALHLKIRWRILPNIIWVFPQLSHVIGKDVENIIIGLASLIKYRLIHRDIKNLCFKELWNVEDDGEDDNRDDILGNPKLYTAGEYSISVVERVTDSAVSEDDNDDNNQEETVNTTHLSNAMATVSPIEQQIVILFRG